MKYFLITTTVEEEYLNSEGVFIIAALSKRNARKIFNQNNYEKEIILKIQEIVSNKEKEFYGQATSFE